MAAEYSPVGPLGKACESEDELKSLRALRRKITETLDSTSDARVIGQLSKQLAEILARMSDIRGAATNDGGKPAGVSDLDKYRVARSAGANN